jgi:transposase
VLFRSSEIGNIDRFPFGERLCSYAGLVPSTHASGKTVRHGGITKEGSR